MGITSKGWRKNCPQGGLSLEKCQASHGSCECKLSKSFQVSPSEKPALSLSLISCPASAFMHVDLQSNLQLCMQPDCLHVCVHFCVVLESWVVIAMERSDLIQLALEFIAEPVLLSPQIWDTRQQIPRLSGTDLTRRRRALQPQRLQFDRRRCFLALTILACAGVLHTWQPFDLA